MLSSSEIRSECLVELEGILILISDEELYFPFPFPLLEVGNKVDSLFARESSSSLTGKKQNSRHNGYGALILYKLYQTFKFLVPCDDAVH